MAVTDLVRFADDARSNKDLLLDLANIGTDQDAILKFINSKGYPVTQSDVDEIEKLAPTQTQYVRQKQGAQAGARVQGVALLLVVVVVFVAVV